MSQGDTPNDIILEYNLPHIDLLKIDIEGAEIEVLETAPEWLSKVNTLIIELHERHRPGCEAALDRALAGQGFVRRTVGANVICTRQTA